MMKRMMLCACVMALAAFARAAEEKAAPQAVNDKGWHDAGTASAGAEAKKSKEQLADEAHKARQAQDPPLKKSAADANGRYPGYRGMTLPLNGHKIAFLKKGDRADVLVTFDAKMADDRKEKVTATILQNVLVINVQKPAKLEDLGVVELLLNPNEAQYAALSIYQGEINIIARSEGDTEMHPMEMASFRKLFK